MIRAITKQNKGNKSNDHNSNNKDPLYYVNNNTSYEIIYIYIYINENDNNKSTNSVRTV